MLTHFNNIQTEIRQDVDPYDLPATPEAFLWSAGHNIRFLDQYIQKMLGHASVFTAPSVAPYWMLPVPNATTYYWLYAGLAKVYVTDGTTNTNLTRQTAAVDVDYTGTAGDIWNGGVISGIPFLNNGVDDPQMWSPVSTSQRLQSLTWSSGQTWASQSKTCKILRRFGQFLIALDLTESSTRYPHRLRWSTSTNSGIPSTWDENDGAEDAGVTDAIGDTGGFMVDCLPLRDVNIIYKEGEAWIQQLVWGDEIMRFDPLFDFGLLAPKCVKPFFGKHLVLTNGDLIVHDGRTPESVIDERYKNWLFNQIDATYYRRSFIVPNHRKKEIWICFPSSGATQANMALIWNYHRNKFYTRDLPGTPHIGYGVVDTSGVSAAWSGDSEAWGDDSSSWDERTYNPTIAKMLMAYGSNFYELDTTNQFAGASFNSYIERQGIDFGDPTRRKIYKKLYPRMESTGPVTFRFGAQETKNGSITWVTKTFDPSTDEFINLDEVAGKFGAIRLQDTSDISWKKHSFSVEWDYLGRY